jgi:hypothetical protein
MDLRGMRFHDTTMIQPKLWDTLANFKQCSLLKASNGGVITGLAV